MPAYIYPEDSEHFVTRTGVQTITGQKTFQSSGASTIPLIVQGAVSQTASLQEWRNDTGALVGKIYPSGSLEVFGSGVIQKTSGTARSRLGHGTANSSDATPVTYEYGVIYTFNDTNPGSSNRPIIGRFIGQAKDSVGAGTNYVDLRFLIRDATDGSEDGSMHVYTLTNGATREVANFGDTTFGYNALLNNFDPAARGLVVRAAASQTASLQEWQNSAGAVVAKVQFNGSAVFGSDVNAIGTITAIPQAATTRPLVVRGAASQSANLTEWQDSAGTVKAQIWNDGTFQTSGSGIYVNTTYSNTPSQLGVVASATNLTTFAIRALASQTANLQQWRDSAGNAMAWIQADAVARFPIIRPLNSGVAAGSIGSGGDWAMTGPKASPTAGIIGFGDGTGWRLEYWRGGGAGPIAYMNDGGAWYAHSYNAISAEATKNNITYLDDATVRSSQRPISERFKQLRPVAYQSRQVAEDSETNPTLYSFVAEEVAEVMPEIVAMGTREYKDKVEGINLTALVTLQTKVIQELMERIEALESR